MLAGSAAADSYWLGTVTVPTPVYQSVGSPSQPIAQLFAGQVVRVYRKQGEYYFVEFIRNMDRTQGWASAKRIWVDRSSKVEGKPPAGQRPATPAPRDPEEAPWTGGRDSLELALFPVYNIYRFGRMQVKFQAAYRRLLGERLSLGFLADCAVGGPFYSVGGGMEAWGNVVTWRRRLMYARGAAWFERFAGGGRSFLAGTLEAGWGFRFRISPSFFLGLEPVSVRYTPLVTAGVPWFLRGQASVSMGGAW